MPEGRGLRAAHSMIDTSAIDFLILANHVEAVNGLLYISGGGWTEQHRRVGPDGKPPMSHFGIGVSVLVPWTETNMPHRLVIQIENDDATQVIARLETNLNVGRPAHLPAGTEQHAAIGISIDTVFPQADGYRVIAWLDDDKDVKRWPFRVVDMPA